MKTTRFYLAVALGLAMSFTISCSGDDGSDGKDGINGTNGVDGASGADGTNGVDGAPGADGAPCDVLEAEGGTWYVMTCNGIEKAKWPKAMCKTQAYDPENMICYDGGIVGVVIGEQVWMRKDYVTGSTDGKYNWAAASVACPTGWTLPSKVDFEELIEGVTTVADLVEKGFSATASSSWWSELQDDTDYAYALNINSSNGVSIRAIAKTTLTSVRCIKE
jgi:hypothetical protein